MAPQLAKVAKPIFAIANSPPAWMKRPALSSSLSSRRAPSSASTSAVVSSAGESNVVEFSEDEVDRDAGGGSDDWDNDSTGGDDSSLGDGDVDDEE